MMKTTLKKYIALLLAILLVIAPLAGCNAATEVSAEPLSGLEPLPGSFEILTQTLQTPIGLQGFALGWDADPNELIEIGVQFVTPPAVALRLMHDGEQPLLRSLAENTFEEQAQIGHDAFWEQIAPLTRARTAQIEILSEHNLLFNGVFVRVPVHMVEQIAALPEVFSVMPNEVYEYEPIIEEPEAIIPLLSDSERFMGGVSELFDLDYIHNELGITGAGVRVAFEDSGIDHDHPRFAPFLNPETGRIRGWCFPSNSDHSPVVNAHGTLVTGPVIAIAPGVEIWHFRTGGNTFQSIQLIEMAHQEGIDVLNRSWVGRPLFDMAHNLAVLDGMIIVNSAGNAGSPFSVHRATDSLIISVAAGIMGYDMGDTSPPDWDPDRIANFSSRGPSSALFRIAPDITATGGFVMTTDLGGGYRLANGTSMSAPMITAVAALLLDAFPDAPPYEIKARMMNTSRQLSVQEDNSVFNIGAGFVQPIEALTSTAFATVQNDIPWSIPTLAEFTLAYTFQEATLSSLSFGAVKEHESKPLTVTIHNPGVGTWVPEVRYNNHLRDHSGVSLELIDSDVSGETHTFTYQMTFANGVPEGMYEGNLVFTNEAQSGQFITMPFGAYFGQSTLDITPAAGSNFTAFVGYTEPPAAQTIAIRSLPIWFLTPEIVLSGLDVDSFTFEVHRVDSGLFLNEIGIDIIVQPKSGLPLGTHRATITLLAYRALGLATPHSIDVSFSVLDPATARTVTFQNDGVDTLITVFPNHPIDWNQSPEVQEVYNVGHEFATGWYPWGSGTPGRAFWGWFRSEELLYDRGFPENRPALGTTGADLSTLTFTEEELEEDIILLAVWSYWGDVDDNGVVEAQDVLFLNRWLYDQLLERQGFPAHFGVQINPYAADVNVDGVVDNHDVLLLNRWLYDYLIGFPFRVPHFGMVLGKPAP